MVDFFAKPHWERRLDGVFKAVLWMAQASEAELAEVVASAKPGEGSEQLLSIAFARWTQIDGLAAFSAFSTLAPELRTSSVTENLFKEWALDGDPEEALDCALAYQKATDDAPRMLVHNMLTGLYEKDPDVATQLAMELCARPDVEGAGTLFGTVGFMVEQRFHRQGLTAALALIGQCPKSGWSENLQADLAERLLASETPGDQAAGAEIFASLPNPYAHTDLLAKIADRRFAADAESAKAWVLAVPVGDARKVALDAIVQSLVSAGKVQDAVDWITPQGSHRDFDEAYQTLALAAIDRKSGDAAFALAELIIAENQRDSFKRSLALRWLEVDFEEAARFIGPMLVNSVTQWDAKSK